MDLMKLAELITDEPQETKPKKYKATAYIERYLRGAMDGIDTDDKTVLEEFIWENCQHGYTCEVIYNEIGERKIFYADKFTTETIGIDELLDDLHLEQQEQM